MYFSAGLALRGRQKTIMLKKKRVSKKLAIWTRNMFIFSTQN